MKPRGQRRRSVHLVALLALTPTFALADVALPESDHVEIRGAPAMAAVAQLVAERYMQDHHDAIVTVSGGGSRRGLKSLVVGTAQLAMATDVIPEDIEKLARDAKVKLRGRPVYSDAVAVVVHPKNPITNLSMHDLRDIFRGKLVHWKEVGREASETARQGGGDAGVARAPQPIKADRIRTPRGNGGSARRPSLPRDAGSLPDSGGAVEVNPSEPADIEVVTFAGNQGPYETLKREVLGDEYVITPRAREVGYQEFYDAITEKAIGYVGIHGVKQLKMVTIDGVVGSVENVRSERYPIRRQLSIYARDPAPQSVTSVLDYFLEPAIGQRLTESLGNVPLR